MADVAENLRTFLLADASVAAKVGTLVNQDVLPQGKGDLFIVYVLDETTKLRCLNETENTPFSYIFAVFCVGQTRDDANSLAILVNARCESAASGGTFGDQTVANVFCEINDDDYQQRAADLNLGEYVAALQVEVFP